MSNLLEETLKLMPGKARQNWALTEGKGSSAKKRESYDLHTMIQPNTTTKAVVARAITQASAGKIVVFGSTGWAFWYDDKRSQWAVKTPSDSYPDFYDGTDKAANAFVKGWMKGESLGDGVEDSAEQQEVIDLLDRVRRPRWEYPDWALPKEDMAESTEDTEDTEGRYSLVRRKGKVHAKGQNKDWWEVMYPTKSGRSARIATITQTMDKDDPYEVEVGTLRPETLTKSFRSVQDAFRAAIARWEKSHARGTP